MRAEIERRMTPTEAPAPRRATASALRIEGDPVVTAAPAPAPPPEAERTFTPKADRRKSDRRAMDVLRDEALRNVISRVEDRNFGGLKNRVRVKGNGHLPRIILMVVALLAGGLAAYLAVGTPGTTTEPAAIEIAPTVIQEPRARILVAKQPIGIGQRLSASLVEWIDWPEGALRNEYVTIAAAPDAITTMAGAVARFEFFPGEPIREEKLAMSGQGFLSAVLEAGMRGVSVTVSAESASGGFIVPNDRVDVVLTRRSGAGNGQVSEIILENVRVLAINARLGEIGTTGAPQNPDDPRAEMFSDEAIATLELDPTASEVVINATTIGRLSLVLRPTSDAAPSSGPAVYATNEAIRMSSPFWTNSNGAAVE